MFDRSIESYKSTNQNSSKIVFFDRGILDTLCYAKLINGNITKEMEWYAKNYRYNSKVFILPPWFDIYKTDSERKQNWEEAVQTYETIVDTYRQYNYELIEVPKTTIDQRLDFIFEKLNLKYDHNP